MVDGFTKYLLPLVILVTPNLFEAGALAKTSTPKTLDDIKQAAKIIHSYGVKNVIIKDFSEGNKSIDILFGGSDYKLNENKLINTTYSHDKLCTFSSCCTAELAKNSNGSIELAVTNAKKYAAEQLRTTPFRLNDYVGTITYK